MNNLCYESQTYLNRYYQILGQMKQDMTTIPQTSSISHNFILQMLPHHQAAINMCQNLLNYTKNPTLIKMAKDIIKEQTKSIADMEKILASCSQTQNSPSDLYIYQSKFNEITLIMFNQMQNACATNNIDNNFVHEMLPHHKGAIFMCKNVQRFNICPELRPICTSIITMQEAGVKKLEHLAQYI